MGESENLIVCVARSVSDEEHYLLQSSDEGWEFPVGHIGAEEVPEEAAIRMLEQEFGLTGEIERAGDLKENIYPVLVNIDFKQVERWEESGYRWFTPLEMTDLDIQDSFMILEELDLVNGDVVTVLVEEGGAFLIMKRSEEKSSSGYWNFIGGRIEEDETVGDAALREASEEAGLTGAVIEIGEPYLSSGELGFWRIHPVLVETEDKTVELNWEHSEHRWIKLEEIEDMKTLSSLKAAEKLGVVDYE